MSTQRHGADCFEILSFVRGSGSNKVYHVRHKETGEHLTMYVISKQDGNVTCLDSLLHTRSFRIPFLTSLRYTFKTKSRHYLVLDSIDNERQLSKYFSNWEPFSLEEVVFLTAEIITAISHLHVCCATYQQLYLENILIDSSGHVQLRRDTSDSSQWAQLECFLCEGRHLCSYHSNVKAEQSKVAKDWKDIGNLVCLLLTGKKAFEEDEKTYESRYSRSYSLPNTLSGLAADFVEGLLQWENNPIPTSLTQSHQFFASIDWNKIAKRQLTPPVRLISISLKSPLKLSNAEQTSFQPKPTLAYRTKDQRLSPKKQNANAFIDQENSIAKGDSNQYLKAGSSKFITAVEDTKSESSLSSFESVWCPDSSPKYNHISQAPLAHKSNTEEHGIGDKYQAVQLYNQTNDNAPSRIDDDEKYSINSYHPLYFSSESSSSQRNQQTDASRYDLSPFNEVPDDVTFVTVEALEESWQRRRSTNKNANGTQSESSAHDDFQNSVEIDNLYDLPQDVKRNPNNGKFENDGNDANESQLLKIQGNSYIPDELNSTLRAWNGVNEHIPQSNKASRYGSIEATDFLNEIDDMDYNRMDRFRSASLNENSNLHSNFCDLETINHAEISQTKNEKNFQRTRSENSYLPEFVRSHSYHGGFFKMKDNNNDQMFATSNLSTVQRANKLLESNFGDWRETFTGGMSLDFGKSEKYSSTEDIKVSVEKAKSLHKRLSQSLQNIRAQDSTKSKIPVSVSPKITSYGQKKKKDDSRRGFSDSNEDINSYMKECLNSSWPTHEILEEEQDSLKKTWPILVTPGSVDLKMKKNMEIDKRNFSLMHKISDGNALQKIKQGAYLQGNRNFNVPRRSTCDTNVSQNIKYEMRNPKQEDSDVNNIDYIHQHEKGASKERIKEQLSPSKYGGKLCRQNAVLSDTDEIIRNNSVHRESTEPSVGNSSVYKIEDRPLYDLSKLKFDSSKVNENAKQQDSVKMSNKNPSHVSRSRNTESPIDTSKRKQINKNLNTKSKQVIEDEIESVDRENVFLPNDDYFDFDANSDKVDHSFITSTEANESTSVNSFGSSSSFNEPPYSSSIQNIPSRPKSSEKRISKLKESGNDDYSKEEKQASVKKKQIPCLEKKRPKNAGIKKAASVDPALHEVNSINIDEDSLTNFIKVPSVNQLRMKNNENSYVIKDDRNKHQNVATDKQDIRNSEKLTRCANQASSSNEKVKTAGTGASSKIPVSRKSLSTGAIAVRKPASISNKSSKETKMKVFLSPKFPRKSSKRIKEAEDLKFDANNNCEDGFADAAGSKLPQTAIDATDLIGKLRVLSEGCRSGRNSPAVERRFCDTDGVIDRVNSVRNILQPSITIENPTPDENSLAGSPYLPVKPTIQSTRNDVSRDSSIGSASDLWMEEEEKQSLHLKRKFCRRSSSGTSGKSNESYEEIRQRNLMSPTLTINSSEDDVSVQTKDLDRASFNSGKSVDSGLSDIFESSREDNYNAAESCPSPRGNAVAKSDSGVMKDIEDNRIGHFHDNTIIDEKLNANNNQENMVKCSACHKRFEQEDKASSVAVFCNRCRSKKVERKEAIVELIQTEINYGQDLRILKEEFFTPIKNGGILSPENFSAVFLNLQELIDVNSKLCITLQDDLEKCILKSDQELKSLNVGKVFLDNVEFFQAYEVFCAKQRQALEVVESLKKKSELFKIFLQVSSKQNSKLRKMDLKSFLAMPVQRIMKYPLLLTRIYRATPRDSPDREALISARRNIEEQIGRINEIATGRPAKLRKCKSTSALNQYNSAGNHMKKLVAEILNWKQEETLVIMSGSLEVSSGELIGVANWTRKSMRKQCSVQTILCAHGVVELVNWSTENGLDESATLPVKSEVTDAAIILLRRKSSNRYAVFKEPILLGQAVIAHRQDVRVAFEICPIMKESLTFLILQAKGEKGLEMNKRYAAALKHEVFDVELTL